MNQKILKYCKDCLFFSEKPFWGIYHCKYFMVPTEGCSYKTTKKSLCEKCKNPFVKDPKWKERFCFNCQEQLKKENKCPHCGSSELEEKTTSDASMFGYCTKTDLYCRECKRWIKNIG